MSTCVTLLANLLCVWSVLTEVVLVVVVMLATSWLLHHQLTTRVILVFSLDLTSVPGRTVRFLVSSRNYLNFVIHYSMPCLALAVKVQCAHVVAAGLTGHCFVGHGISRSHITGYIYYCVQATASTTRWRVSQSRRRCHVSSSRCRDQLQAALTSDMLFSAPSSTFLPFSSTVIYYCYYTGFSPIFKYYTVVHKRCGSGSKLFATTYANLDQFLYFFAPHILWTRCCTLALLRFTICISPLLAACFRGSRFWRISVSNAFNVMQGAAHLLHYTMFSMHHLTWVILDMNGDCCRTIVIITGAVPTMWQPRDSSSAVPIVSRDSSRGPIFSIPVLRIEEFGWDPWIWDPRIGTSRREGCIVLYFSTELCISK